MFFKKKILLAKRQSMPIENLKHLMVSINNSKQYWIKLKLFITFCTGAISPYHFFDKSLELILLTFMYLADAFPTNFSLKPTNHINSSNQTSI